MKMFRVLPCAVAGCVLVLANTPLASQTNFGSVNDSSSVTDTVTVTILNAGTLDNISVSTQGAANLDYTNAGGGTCTIGTAYAANATCTVKVAFKPKLSGTRYGAAVLYDNAGNVMATGFLQGAGAGPQMSFLPGTETTIGNGFTSPSGLAIDGSGNVFIADWNNSRVVKETPAGSSYTQSTIASGFGPGGVAVDSSGNIYITNLSSNLVTKETPVPGGYTESAIGSGMYNPNSVAVDGQGNLYVADAYNGRVLKETLSAGSYVQTDILDCGTVGTQSCPSSVAVDGSGNLFVTSYNSSQILELTPSAGGYTQSTIESDLVWPSAIVADGHGNLYIADTLNSRIVKETLSAGGYIESTVQTSPVDWPWSVAVDGPGNVYVSDTYDNRVLKEDLTNPPALNFAETPAGSTSSDSPQTVTVLNAGNAMLKFPALSTGDNPTISKNFKLNASSAGACPLVAVGSSTPGSLAAGQACQLPISFEPTQAGTFTGALVLTDNNGNAAAPAYASQSIALAGQSLDSSSTTLTVSAPQVQQGQTVTLTATVAGSAGQGTPTGQVTFSGNGLAAATVALNASGVAAWTTPALAVSLYSVTANYSGNAIYGPSTSQPVSFTVTSVPPAKVVAVGGPNWSTQYGSALTLCAKVTDSSNTALPGVTVNFGGARLAIQQASTVTGANGQACTAVNPLQTGSLLATASVQGVAPSATFPINVTQAPLTVTVLQQSRLYGAANPNLTYSISGLVNGDTLTIALKTTAIVTSPVGTYPVTATVSGLAAANYNINVIDSTLNILRASLTVTVHGSWRLYGAANPSFTFTTLGLLNSDTVTVTTQTTATPASPIGSYPVTATATGPATVNYNINVVPGILTVLKALLQIEARNESVAYGQTPAQPTAYVLIGFVNGDTASIVSGAPVLSTSATSTSPVGFYPIGVQVGSLSAANYQFSTVANGMGSVGIYKAPLTIRPNSFTIHAGDPLPTFTYAITGFVNGDTQPSATTGAPKLTTTAPNNTTPGRYYIIANVGTLVAKNYSFNQPSAATNGILTILAN